MDYECGKMRQLKCSMCTQLFRYKDKLKRHLQTVHAVRLDEPFKCNFCRKSFKRYDQLQEHVKNLHPETLLSNYLPNVCSTVITKKEDDIKQELNIP